MRRSKKVSEYDWMQILRTINEIVHGVRPPFQQSHIQKKIKLVLRYLLAFQALVPQPLLATALEIKTTLKQSHGDRNIFMRTNVLEVCKSFKEVISEHLLSIGINPAEVTGSPDPFDRICDIVCR